MSEALRTPELSEEALNFVAGTSTRAPAPPAAVIAEEQALSPGNTPLGPNLLAPGHHLTTMLPKPPPHLSVVVPAIVFMTFRLPAPLSTRLARIAAERKIQRDRPFSQQDIVATALEEWFQRHGHLE